MSRRISLAAVVMMATASVAWAVDVRVRFEARGLGSDVQWSQIKDGFILDVYLDADAPMVSAGFSIAGDPGFGHEGVEVVIGDSLSLANYEEAQGWSGSPSDGETFSPASLPLTGGASNELGTIAIDLNAGASNGLFAWLEFTQVPAEGAYTIQPGDVAYLGDLNFQPMDLVSITPLTINGGAPPDGGGSGGGGGGDGGDGDTGDGDTGDGDTGDGDTGDGDTGDGDTGDGDTGDGDTGDGDTGDGDTGDGDTGDGSDNGDGGVVIVPPDNGGGEGPVDTRVPPLCAAGGVEATIMSLVGLVAFAGQRRRRHWTQGQ